MSAIHGKNGTITFTGITPVNITSWSLDANCDMADATEMSQTEKVYLAGLKDWTASADCLVDSGGLAGELAAVSSSATLTLTYYTDKTIAGNAICTGMSVGVGIDGAETVSYTFQGSGGLT